MQTLHPSTLDQVDGSVWRPSYDRELLRPGIVHLGLGAFHRAHQAVYTEQAVAHSGGDWGIIGVSMRSDTVARQLRPQAGLYSVLSQDANSRSVSVIGVIKDVLVAAHEPTRVANAIADPAIKILTLTITEKGYCLAADGQSLDRDNPLITADLQSPRSPSSAIGLIALGLHLRQQHGGEPVSIISCDNLSENSKRLKAVLRDYLTLSFPEVITWMECSASFPCSMVDRIVPGMTGERLRSQASLLGVRDEGAVSTEQFSQWIIEDRFVTQRPAWDKVGVQFVSNILPFENIKLRILNASHSAIAFCGLLAGLETVAQVMADAQLADFIEQLMDEELIPALEAPDGFDLLEYKTQLLQRFRNPALQHRCAQIAMDSSEKIPQRWLPTLNTRQSANKLKKALGAWCYYVLCTDLDIDDPQGERLLLLRHSKAPMAERLAQVLGCARLLPDNTVHFETLRKELLSMIETLSASGLCALLKS